MEEISGRRFRGRYAVVTDVSTGSGIAGRRQHRAPLQVARRRTHDLFAAGIRVGGGPRAPGLVRRCRVAAPGEDVHRAGIRCGAPADHAPGRDGARIPNVGLERAAPRRGRRQRKQLPRIACRADDAARGFAKKRSDLAGGGAGEERGACRISADAEDLPFRAGADEQAARRFDDDVVGRILTGIPQGVPQAVGPDAVDRATPCLARLARRLTCRGGAAGRAVNHCHRGDLGRH